MESAWSDTFVGEDAAFEKFPGVWDLVREVFPVVDVCGGRI